MKNIYIISDITTEKALMLKKLMFTPSCFTLFINNIKVGEN